MFARLGAVWRMAIDDRRYNTRDPCYNFPS